MVARDPEQSTSVSSDPADSGGADPGGDNNSPSDVAEPEEEQQSTDSTGEETESESPAESDVPENDSSSEPRQETSTERETAEDDLDGLGPIGGETPPPLPDEEPESEDAGDFPDPDDNDFGADDLSGSVASEIQPERAESMEEELEDIGKAYFASSPQDLGKKLDPNEAALADASNLEDFGQGDDFDLEPITPAAEPDLEDFGEAESTDLSDFGREEPVDLSDFGVDDSKPEQMIGGVKKAVAEYKRDRENASGRATAVPAGEQRAGQREPAYAQRGGRGRMGY